MRVSSIKNKIEDFKKDNAKQEKDFIAVLARPFFDPATEKQVLENDNFVIQLMGNSSEFRIPKVDAKLEDEGDILNPIFLLFIDSNKFKVIKDQQTAQSCPNSVMIVDNKTEIDFRMFQIEKI